MGSLAQDFDAYAASLPEPDVPEVIRPISQQHVDKLFEERRIANLGGTLYNSTYNPQAGSLADEFDRYPPEKSTVQQPLNWLDYLEDIGVEAAAGFLEGVSLENIDIEQILSKAGVPTSIGEQTVPGDIARVVARFGGSIIPYALVGKFLPYIGIAKGAVATPTVLARAGATAFTARMLTGIVPDVVDGEFDLIDRIDSSLLNAGIGIGVAGLPIAAGSALLKMRGGPVKYLNRMKEKLSTHLTQKLNFTPEQASEVVANVEQTVANNGGAKALNAAAINRVVKGQKALANTWKPLNRQVHAIADDLGLSKTDFRKANVEWVGKAHTNDMTIKELQDLTRFYQGVRSRIGPKPVKPPDFKADMTQVVGQAEGIGTRFRPVERNMTRWGLGKEYEIIYDAEVSHVGERGEYFKMMRPMVKGLSKQNRVNVFNMKDKVEIPLDATDEQMYSIYAANAKRFGVDNRGVEMATWMRSNERQLLKRMNAVLAGEGKNPISERAAYATHTAMSDVSRAQGGITLDEFKAMKKVKPKIFARFLEERKDMIPEEFLEKDVVKAHTAYVRSGLKMIHMRPAMSQFNKGMANKTEFVDGQLVRKTFTEDVHRYVDDWFKHGIQGRPTHLDKAIDKTIGYSSARAISALKMAGYRGTLWGNPLSVIKNTTQQSLNYAKLGKYWFEGLGSFVPNRNFHGGLTGTQFAERYSKLLRGRQPALEGMDPTTLGWFTKIGFAPFRFVDKYNIVAGFNGAFRKNMAEGKGFEQSVELADRLVRNTQFNYMNIDSPLVFLSGPGRLASQFQSWWTRYLEEVWSWGGEFPYGDGTSRVLRVAKQGFNVAKSREFSRYMSFNLITMYAMYKAGLGTGLIEAGVPIPGSSRGPVPRGLPPALSGLLSMGSIMMNIAAGDIKAVRRELPEFERSILTHTIPGYNTIRKMYNIQHGKSPSTAMFFPQSSSDYEEFVKSHRGRRNVPTLDRRILSTIPGYEMLASGPRRRRR